jgi:uncharacterized protein YdbL (DUF1318 family)
MNPIKLFLYLFALSLAPAMLVAQSAEIAEATERMKERLSAVDALKTSGKLGEDNMGYLAVRDTLTREEQELLNAENRDRRLIYQHVARSSRQSVDEVGRQRAARIAELAREGVWLQNRRGEWYQKSD